MDADWPTRLRENENSLTKAEHSLIEYVNRHPEHAVRLTQRELAEEAAVSKPVIISCFRRLGYSSFREFQTAIEQFFGTQIDSLVASRRVHERVPTLQHLVEEAAAVDSRTLERMRAAIDVATLEAIAVRLHEAESVFVMGLSTGHYPAHYLAQRLPRYGITTVLIEQDERHLPDMFHLIGPDDVLVLFHYSDDDRRLRRALDPALRGRTWTAVISATIHPTYVAESDLFVHVPRGEMEFKNSMAVPMHFANLMLLTYEHVYRAEVEEQLTQLESTRRVWSDTPG